MNQLELIDVVVASISLSGCIHHCQIARESVINPADSAHTVII